MNRSYLFAPNRRAGEVLHGDARRRERDLLARLRGGVQPARPG